MVEGNDKVGGWIIASLNQVVTRVSIHTPFMLLFRNIIRLMINLIQSMYIEIVEETWRYSCPITSMAKTSLFNLTVSIHNSVTVIFIILIIIIMVVAIFIIIHSFCSFTSKWASKSKQKKKPNINEDTMKIINNDHNKK